MELRLDELKLMEARERFRREHESELNRMLRSRANPRRAFTEFMRELWSKAEHAQPGDSQDASPALGAE